MLFMNKKAKPLSIVYIQILDVPFCSQYREIIDFWKNSNKYTILYVIEILLIFFFNKNPFAVVAFVWILLLGKILSMYFISLEHL